MKKVILLKTDGNVLAYDTIQAAINAGVSGDCVVVYPGTYDQGSSSLIIKDGVDIECIGKVTISSSNATATIVDNNVAAVISLKGFPIITNTGGLAKRIVLANAGSKVNDLINTGTYYTILNANGTTSENGSELLSAYATIKAAASGLSLSATKRYTIYVPAGLYTLSANLVMDTPYIDVQSLSGKMDVLFETSAISITSDNVNVTGINVQAQVFTIATSLANIVVTNCKGTGNYSFAGISGGGSVASGTYINCVGGSYSFGGNSTASGTFANCVGGAHSFGGNGGTASGIFTNCVGGDFSFGGIGTASGTFTNCTGGEYSFGGGATLSGKLYYCRLTTGTFETVSGAGKTVLCIDGNNAVNTQ